MAVAAPSYFFAPAGGWLRNAHDVNDYLIGLDFAARRDIAAARLIVYGQMKSMGTPIFYSNESGLLIHADGEILALWVDGVELPAILNKIRTASSRAGC